MFEIRKINLTDFFAQQGQNQEMNDHIESLYNEISIPRFHLKDVGISSKIINDWVKAEILDKPDDERKWREFSFTEAIWLKFIEELRFFGTPLKTIKGIKENFYDPNPEIIRLNIEAISKMRHQNEVTNLIQSSYLRIIKEIGNLYHPDILKYLSLFKTTLVHTLIGEINPAYLFSKSNEGFFDFGENRNVFGKNQEKKVIWQYSILKESFAVINIKSLLNGFFETEKPNIDLNFYYGIMTKKEKELLDRIRSKNYTKITVTLEEEKIVLTKALKKNDESMIKNFARLMKKGEFKDVEFSTRDGKIIKFNEIELIK